MCHCYLAYTFAAKINGTWVIIYRIYIFIYCYRLPCTIVLYCHYRLFAPDQVGVIYLRFSMMLHLSNGYISITVACYFWIQVQIVTHAWLQIPFTQLWLQIHKLDICMNNLGVGDKFQILVMLLFFSCDQAALRTPLSVYPSVRPSVCLSACYTILQCSSRRIIMKFSGVITYDRSDVHAKGEGQRPKVKVTEVNTPFSRFRTVTQVWIDIWWWNDAQSLMLLRRGALLFFNVIRQISRSHS